MKKTVRLALLLVFVATLVLVIPASAAGVTYTSGFQVQNLDQTNTATIDIYFYNQDGSLAADTPDTIDPGASKTYYPLTAVTSGFNGSVVVSSDRQIAAITNVLGNSGVMGAAYDGFSSGATTVSIPLVMKDNYGISTWFNVQNTGADADVTVAFAGTACTETKNVKQYASQTFDQATNTCLPASKYANAATVTSTSPVVVTVMEVNGTTLPNLLAYNGFAAASTNPVMPLVSSGWYKSGTGIQIQNTGGTATDVTITYTPSDGFPGASCTETKTVPAGGSSTFAYPSMPAACYTSQGSQTSAFVGSGKVTDNSASMNLVAVVNEVTASASSAEAYGAFDPNTATANVSLPLIMDRNYGIFTGISVANVGTQPTNISCVFSGTSYTATATNVAPGAALTDVQSTKIADKYVGSAVCTATGGDAKIAAVVNELTGGVPATTDALLVYEGINY